MDSKELFLRLERIENLLFVNKRALTFVEGCSYTGYKAKYMYQLTSKNLIPHFKPNNGAIFFDKKELDSYLLSNKKQSKEEINAKALEYAFKSKK